ncbi:beta-ketoacyl-ACP synthase 3 [Chitinophaga oryzae]|uniref:Beta-ketoacyl-ACP synthase 3 n=1 Tax=Chitinophaga oryzae TaxID=2725414 RepID=A0AAE6ZDD9_9BACT|nr:beta-ketoacyl-ACP synthase 3 [Chitinophaga oryzae]QJB30918.1 beta-ketoacyl-ACP synthase 3 [Chitinophaga oryzae]QJB37407.1 beta-ketoacyl-ACP synthase 3 [Chitinophaga oryzae]
MAITITGAGHFLPEPVIDNKMIVSRINTTEDFILSRTGVVTRRHLAREKGLSSLLVPACLRAIEHAGLQATDIDMLIVNTLSPDHHDPSEACFIQPMLGLRHVPVFDIRAQCSGLLYGMELARNLLTSGVYKHILVACGEVLSKRMDTSDDGRNLSILLGDGAGAVVLSNSPAQTSGIIDLMIKADGSCFELLWTAAPGTAQSSYTDSTAIPHFRMNGKPMFENATQRLCEIAQEILERNGLKIDDIDIVLPHQPNLRILEAVREKLSVPPQKFVTNVERYGNMASASLAVTMSEYVRENHPCPGALALVLTYGSGATWGAMLYRF